MSMTYPFRTVSRPMVISDTLPNRIGRCNCDCKLLFQIVYQFEYITKIEYFWNGIERVLKNIVQSHKF